jgi:hypothetical protein
VSILAYSLFFLSAFVRHKAVSPVEKIKRPQCHTTFEQFVSLLHSNDIAAYKAISSARLSPAPACRVVGAAGHAGDRAEP